MSTLLFVGQFVAGKVGATGLAVTVDVDAYDLATGSRFAVVTGGAATEGRRGLYHYRLADAEPSLYQYVATFVAADTSVDCQEIAALGLVVPDVLVSSRASQGSVDELAALGGSATVAISAAQAEQVASGRLAIRSHHTFTQAIHSTSLADLANLADILLAVKDDVDDDDDDALLFLSQHDGLLYVNGEPYGAPWHGAIEVAGSAGDWTLSFSAAVPATALLPSRARCHAEVKGVKSDGETLAIWDGEAVIGRGVVQSHAVPDDGGGGIPS